MVEIEQANVRVPANSKASLVRIAKRLRDEPAFLHRLNRFLDEEENPATGAFLADRIERLEHKLAELMADRGAVRDATATPTPSPSAEAPLSEAPKSGDGHPPWTYGEGRGRRLTVEGETELFRLLSVGWTDAQIATHLGVKPFTVATKRKKQNTSED